MDRTLWTRKRNLKPRTRRILLAGAIALMGVLSVVVMLDLWAIREARQFSFLPDDPLYPKTGVVCRTGPSPDCATEAAQRVGFPAAWMMPPPGYHLRWLVALRPANAPVSKAIVEESLSSDDIVLGLTSHPGREWPMQFLRVYRVGEIAVRAYTDYPGQLGQGMWTLTFRWSRGGHAYSLFVAPHRVIGIPPMDVDQYATFLDAVRYTNP